MSDYVKWGYQKRACQQCYEAICLDSKEWFEDWEKKRRENARIQGLRCVKG
jgi:hypothetical protein